MAKLSTGGSRMKAIETAPPRILRLERRPTMEKKLETIVEEGDHDHTYKAQGGANSCSSKTSTFYYSSRNSAASSSRADFLDYKSTNLQRN